MSNVKSNSGGNGKVVAIIAMFFLFAMISFVTNLAAPIGTIWGYKFAGNSFVGMLGNLMNFLAYACMGIPAGIMLTKIGYKKTALWAMAIGVIGLAVQLISSTIAGEIAGFVFYLAGAFICGFCVCMLNTVVNPMLNLLGGGGNKGNQLLQTGGALNSLAAALSPLFVGMLIGELSKNSSLTDVAPLLWIAMGVLAVAFLIIYFVNIPEPGLAKGVKAVKYAHSPWNFRHFVLGTVAIFFYVGIEVSVPYTLNFWISDQGPTGAGVVGKASAIAGALVAIYWLLMLAGRSISGMISGKVSTRAQLISVTSLAIMLIVIAIIMPKELTFTVPAFIYQGEAGELAHVPVSALFLVLCGICTSVMWGNIFNLAVEGLGKYTAKASGIFMMMVVGGGIIPQLQQLIVGKDGHYMESYWLIVAALAFLLFYAVTGYKNVNRDIPVAEEEIEEGLENSL